MLDTFDRAIGRLQRFFLKRWLSLSKFLITDLKKERTVTRQGLTFELDPTDDLQRRVLFGGLHGEKERQICTELLESDSVVIDIGAHIGLYTVFFAKIVSAGKVHAFEPNPGAFMKLQRHAEINECDNIVLNNLALGEQSKTVTLQVPEGRTGSATLSEHLEVTPEVGDTISVPVIRLDDYLSGEDIEHVNLIKLDAEGYEPFVLRGATSTLQQHRPLILMEVNSLALQRHGWTSQELLNSLASFGYKFYKASHLSSRLRRINSEGNHGSIYDVICFPTEMQG